MRRTVIALCFAACLHANTITYSISTGGIGETGYSDYVPMFASRGTHIDYSSSLVAPAFDPKLGTLDGISFTIQFLGSVQWDIISQPPIGFTDWGVRATADYLGVIDDFQYSPILAPSSFCTTGQQFPNDPPAGTCSPISSTFGTRFIANGNIGSGSSSMTNGDKWAPHTFTGSPTNDLKQFLGLGTVQIPFSLSVDSYPLFPAGILGDPISASAFASLAWTYNYSAAPVMIESLEITPTPEPGSALAVLICMAAMVFAIPRRTTKC